MSIEKELVDLLKEFSGDNTEVYETMMYVLHSDGTMMAAEGAQANAQTELRNVPPESIMMMDRYASGMVRNTFFHTNYAAISTAIARDHIRTKVLYSAAKGADKGLPHGAGIVRDLIANRYDALATVVFCHSGYDACYEFELKFRTIIRATPQEVLAAKATV